jgi:hypothetical protein
MKESILLTSDEVLSRLAEGPPRISTAADGLSAKQLRTSPDDGWSANEVLAHLRACGDVWGGHIIAIVEEDRPTRRGISPRTWMKKTNYTDLDFRESFAAFSAQRADLLHVLEELTPEDWSRTALIKSYGSMTNEHSALFFADGLARHERVHVKQIEQVAAAIRAS